jgi:hypothetical protein
MKYEYEQLAEESARAFEAFSLYLEMGPDRSLSKLAQRLGKSLDLMKRWSSRHSWAQRIAAHAEHLAARQRNAEDRLCLEKAALWMERQESLREQEWELHEQCILAGRKALEMFMAKEMKAAKLSDIAKILELASKLGRLASGMSTLSIEHTGTDGGPIRVEFEAALKKVYGPVVEVEAEVEG